MAYPPDSLSSRALRAGLSFGVQRLQIQDGDTGWDGVAGVDLATARLTCAANDFLGLRGSHWTSRMFLQSRHLRFQLGDALVGCLGRAIGFAALGPQRGVGRLELLDVGPKLALARFRDPRRSSRG